MRRINLKNYAVKRRYLFIDDGYHEQLELKTKPERLIRCSEKCEEDEDGWTRLWLMEDGTLLEEEATFRYGYYNRYDYTIYKRKTIKDVFDDIVWWVKCKQYNFKTRNVRS